MDCLFLLLWSLQVPLALQFCCFHSVTSVSFTGDTGVLYQDYDFSIPVEVDSLGGYISHDVSRHGRSRRSLSEAGGPVHYHVSAFGKELHLDLQPSHVLAEGFTVQTLGAEGINTAKLEPSIHNCLYQGSIRNHSGSSVAISTCTGLSGLIRFSSEELLITPLSQHLALQHNYSAPSGHHPHVIYKRSAERRVYSDKTDWISSVKSSNPYKDHHHHHHRHHDYQHGKLQRQHFCGRRKQYSPKRPTEDHFVMPDEFEQQSRVKRSEITSSKEGGLNVETLVVADRKMLEKHGRENVTTYVLTVMNMVSSLFKDGTIGNDINIVVVSLLLLEKDPLGLSINHHADQSLNNFCQWQSGLIGKNGKRHDHAILLTGLDICSWKNEPCDTLGFAPISGMCSKYRSCTINEDTGLGLAFTIAHESGHNFGMIHDGEGNPSQASCLVDEPKQIGQYKYPEQLPGQLYDADIQCKWQFGSKAKLCSLDFVKDICKSLWCHRTGHRCETKFMPAAEGTICGPDMWCRRGQCVKFGDHGPTAVHGQWSGWSEWSDCSRTCGGGVMYRERSCNSPSPQHNGKFCQGPGRLHQLCNTKRCQPNGVDFRAQQCAEYNSKPFRGWYYKWKPYTKVEEEDICKLYCIAEDFDFFFAMSSKVKDGTSCSDYKGGVCIDGICKPVGCDQVLGSKAALDACGVCKGDNSTCTFYSGQYTLQHRANGKKENHYKIIEKCLKTYYLTGDWTVDWPARFQFAGTMFNYQRSFNHPEILYATGPTNETLLFEILLQGKNPGISWEYTLPHPEKKHNYTWSVVRSDCSAPCAGGELLPYVQFTSEGQIVCLDSWTTGKWGVCSRACGGGQQTRNIRCMRKVTYQREEVVAHSLCPVMAPAQLQPCNTQTCPPEWSTGSWSQCSKTCGRGLKKRTVFCRSTNPGARAVVVPDSMCKLHLKPKAQETCVLSRCPKNERLQWITTTWGECSASCGAGVKKRELQCGEKDSQGGYTEFPVKRCRNLRKPQADLEQACNNGPCLDPPPPQILQPGLDRGGTSVTLGWYSSPWLQCTVSCGGGVQTRSVQCLRQGRLSVGCLPHQRPISSRACNTHFCPEDQLCIDFFSWCHLVPQHGVCNHKFYGQQCCKSCSAKRQ
uniref:ADAM metallopeptidase with thrombospondin type 1 motif, 18 n=1 Tax=Cyprinus carpio TaxID=7962 RepID=A0A8C2JPE4_CYPCA